MCSVYKIVRTSDIILSIKYTPSDNRSHIVSNLDKQIFFMFSAEQFSTAKRHHSGHFRHATAEVWDPHPQYEFTAFGRRFRLRLAHDASFVSPDIKVSRIDRATAV